ncbi:MAG TPA: CaiB/BaiF CoA-transferase family protein [Xanthobacteraceae bacterium]|nr:CaiB/BaiF CoA-transferase family protein [Xanthobacteraceae bacterium]
MGSLLFEGLKVIDCASFIAAPAAATMLSDFGATVIKIEPPGAGDPFRTLSELPGNPKSAHNYAWMLEARNKRSLALDLTSAEGQAVLRHLLVQTDVFITNFPHAVRRRLGITYEDLGPLNARLIYASFSGYGETGAEANKPGFDTNAWWARSGLMDVVRAEAQATPARSVPGMGDHPSAVSLYAAIVTALYRREHTGKGGHVATSLMANGVWSNGYFVQARLCGASIEPRPRREHGFNALTNHYRCSDGRWLILSLLNENRQWPVLVSCLGRPELLDDPLFATRPARHANARALIAILDEIFATRDLAEWRRSLDAAGLIFGVVATLDDIAADEQMRVNEVLIEFENDAMLTINSPLWVEGADKVRPRHPPALGEHSDEILRGAGYDDAAIQKLRIGGIVG